MVASQAGDGNSRTCRGEGQQKSEHLGMRSDGIKLELYGGGSLAGNPEPRPPWKACAPFPMGSTLMSITSFLDRGRCSPHTPRLSCSTTCFTTCRGAGLGRGGIEALGTAMADFCEIKAHHIDRL